MRAALGAWWELLRATLRWYGAKLSSMRRECPPHEYDSRFTFCLKCGAFAPRDGERAS